MAERPPSSLMLAILGLAATREHGVPVRDVVEAFGQTRPSISRAMRRLARRGAVILHRSAMKRQGQRRLYAHRVTVTPIGLKLLAVNSLSLAGRN